MRKQITTLVVLSAATLAGAGCSDPVEQPAAQTGAPAITAAPTLSDQQAPPQRVVIDVTIADGKVAPVNQQMQAAVRQPIIIRVTSDTDDELHVHASPEHTFTVKPGPLQSFQFEVEVPGKVDVELHRLHRVVATITVQ